MSYSQALEEQIKLMRKEEGTARGFAMRQKPDAAHDAGDRSGFLDLADPFYWAPDICSLMERVPVDAVENTVLRSELFPCNYGFWWFASPIKLPRWDGDCTDMQAILWSALGGANGTGIKVWTYHYFHGRRPIERLSPEGGFMEPDISNFGVFAWQYGETLKDALWAGLSDGRHRSVTERDENRLIADSPWHREALQRFTAMLLFMDQRILVPAQQCAERQTRKRLERQGFAHTPLIRVVELRRKQARSEHHGDSDSVEWSHRWIVSGHWRQQWYPSLNANQPVWIMPYIKGPEDKPLKPPRAKVFAVVR